ncbi:MAG: hypothetical protein OXR68_07745 [Alphaproteobacteria bacterium]|nr:hypothetical protein [Alphaproteobacteria bacterium]MDD9920497.1 hypothetical protein [Alphaproteobacteria bacterium]
MKTILAILFSAFFSFSALAAEPSKPKECSAGCTITFGTFKKGVIQFQPNSELFLVSVKTAKKGSFKGCIEVLNECVQAKSFPEMTKKLRQKLTQVREGFRSGFVHKQIKKYACAPTLKSSAYCKGWKAGKGQNAKALHEGQIK